MTDADLTRHLWEPEHDYYGPEAPWWGHPDQYRPYINHFESWAEFAHGGAMSDAPLGLNLLYRWDWHAWHLEFPEDYPNGQERHEVELFWMMPRKGIMARSSIAVTPDDEPAVRAWLAPHWDYMRALWAPLAERDALAAQHAALREGVKGLIDDSGSLVAASRLRALAADEGEGTGR